MAIESGSNTQKPRVVIVGGGFAGLQAAMHLAGKPVEVMLIDRRNHHTFQPLLYQVRWPRFRRETLRSPSGASFVTGRTSMS